MSLISALYFYLISAESLAAFGLPFVIGAKHIVLVCIIILVGASARPMKIALRSYILLAALFFAALASFLLSESVRGVSFLISFLFTFYPLVCMLIARGAAFTEADALKLVHGCLLVSLISALPSFIGIFAGYDPRFFSLMYREAAALGSTMALSILYILFLVERKVITNSRAILYLIIPAVMILETVLKKNILSLILVFFLYWVMASRRRFSLKMLSSTGLITIVFVSVAGQELLLNVQKNVDYFANVGMEGHIRLAMYLVAFQVNIDTFGLGSGIGSFGSLGSIIGEISTQGIEYSFAQTYYDYGVADIAGNSAEKLNQGEAGTLLDTYWPHIIAEFGVFGLLLMTAFIASLITFERRFFYPIMCIFVVYFDGLFIIYPESPQFIFFGLVLPLIIMQSLRYDGDQKRQ